MSDAQPTGSAPDAAPPAHGHEANSKLTLASALGVLGVVYGDIGTSPLYALKASLLHFEDGGIERWEILGVLSLIFWSLMLTVTVKYVMVIMRADNRGEGGILALMALAMRTTTTTRGRWIVVMLGIIGASLFFGDGIITPAISVLSAMEGLKVVDPIFEEAVVPGSLLILIALFAVQYRGTGQMGKVFGPICALWFLAIGLLGLWEVLLHPSVLLALSPSYAFNFVLHYHTAAFIALGAVVLSVTGAEALYADMGHFGRRPIRIMWSAFVLPALALNYFGQGALLLREPTAIENPFFLLAPEILRLPLVVLACLATVIASQAMISGAFSIARQCVQLGLLPRLVVRHTSATEEGQIYVPQINTILLIGVLVLVLEFKNSDSLAAAYGFAVTGTFIASSILATIVLHRVFGWSMLRVAVVFVPLLLLDLGYFIATALKVPDGGYVPMILGLITFAMMATWYQGRQLLFQRLRQDSLPLKSFLARLPQSRTIRVPGIAIFMTGEKDFLPGALLHNLKHNKVLHEKVLFVTVSNEDIPVVGDARRREVVELAPGIHRVMLHYGFQESPNVPRELETLNAEGHIAFEPMQASYFLGRETIVQAAVPKLWKWQQWLFRAMQRNSMPATEFFRIPPDRVVELGVRIAV
ncbi:potassium transporter Kup [Rhodovarius crocodyli]|uniref:Probable potassium transport system protein Kup n=1 Tax=Rhodovarius crocodyli TaxID=1979269 RepID=A0A437MM29_9PROT|nr:potassium transporter Kup [Rhodovarius crocodyli]RVT98717.1 potassium transporter Kup [Rhodovarius crocodyli]